MSGQTVNDSAIGWFFNSILFFNCPASSSPGFTSASADVSLARSSSGRRAFAVVSRAAPARAAVRPISHDVTGPRTEREARFGCDRDLSFPGSAWERTALQALPAELPDLRRREAEPRGSAFPGRAWGAIRGHPRPKLPSISHTTSDMAPSASEPHRNTWRKVHDPKVSLAGGPRPASRLRRLCRPGRRRGRRGGAAPFRRRTAQNGRHADRHAVAGFPATVRTAVPLPLPHADPHRHVRPPARPGLPALPLPDRRLFGPVPRRPPDGGRAPVRRDDEDGEGRRRRRRGDDVPPR